MRDSIRPIYRRIIVPWYDAEAVCVVVIALMAPILVFGVVGMSVSRQAPEYRDHLWVPASLLLLSAFVAVSTAARLIRRWTGRNDP